MISVQKCQFLAISEDWTNVYAYCSFKLISNNECLVYIHSSDFDLIIYVTKIRQFHVSQFWLGTGPISLFVVLALWYQNYHYWNFSAVYKCYCQWKYSNVCTCVVFVFKQIYKNNYMYHEQILNETHIYDTSKYPWKTRNVSETYMPSFLQNLKLLLICTRHGCNPSTKFGIDQVKGSKDIKRTTHWAEKSGLTLTLNMWPENQ